MTNIKNNFKICQYDYENNYNLKLFLISYEYDTKHFGYG